MVLLPPCHFGSRGAMLCPLADLVPSGLEITQKYIKFAFFGTETA